MASSHKLKFIFQKKLDQGTVVIATVRVIYPASSHNSTLTSVGSDFNYVEGGPMAEPSGPFRSLLTVEASVLYIQAAAKVATRRHHVLQSSPSPGAKVLTS